MKKMATTLTEIVWLLGLMKELGEETNQWSSLMKARQKCELL